MRRELSLLARSFRCAFHGMALGLHERNFRIHLMALCYVSIAARLADFDALRFSVLFLCYGLVLCAELCNTAIEALCDRITCEYDAHIGRVKDIAAGAVLAAAMLCVCVAAALFVHAEVWAHIAARLEQNKLLDGALVLTAPAAVWFIFRFGENK